MIYPSMVRNMSFVLTLLSIAVQIDYLTLTEL